MSTLEDISSLGEEELLVLVDQLEWQVPKCIGFELLQGKADEKVFLEGNKTHLTV